MSFSCSFKMLELGTITIYLLIWILNLSVPNSSSFQAERQVLWSPFFFQDKCNNRFLGILTQENLLFKLSLPWLTLIHLLGHCCHFDFFLTLLCVLAKKQKVDTNAIQPCSLYYINLLFMIKSCHAEKLLISNLFSPLPFFL